MWINLIDWPAALLSIVLLTAIGMIWYAPFAFGPAWQKLTGVTDIAPPHMRRAVLGGMASNFVAIMASHVIFYWATPGTVAEVIWRSLLIGGGIAIATLIPPLLWENRDPQLLKIQGGLLLINYILIGLVWYWL